MAAQSTLRRSPTEQLSDLFDHFYARLVDRIEKHRRRAGPSARNTRLIATLALSLAIISGGYGGYRYYRHAKREADTGRALLRRNSGLRSKDGSRIIYVPYKDDAKRIVIYPTKQTTFDAHRRHFLEPPEATRLNIHPAFGAPPANIKPGVNLAFLHQFLAIMKVAIPRWRSRESALFFTHLIALFSRTYLSLVVARLDGAIVRDIIAGKARSFMGGIAKWFALGIVSAYINSSIKFLQAKLSIAFRTRLTRYIHDLYLSPSLAYYKLHNLDGGVGSQADQFITQDLTLFCDSAASLFSNLGKPAVDLIIFNAQLYQSLGGLALTGLLTNYMGTMMLLRKMSPPFGKMKAAENKKEGDFRALHARLIANAEEVAFYAGGPTEHVLLEKGFKDLTKISEYIHRLKITFSFLEDYVLKYSWSALGYLVSSLPIFMPVIGLSGETANAGAAKAGAQSGDESMDLSQGRTKDFVVNKRIMLSLADAGARMMYSLKDLNELSGYTSRVFTLMSSLHRVHANAYPAIPGRYPELYSLSDVQGTLVKGFDGVRLEMVPIVAPSLYPGGGEELIDNLNLLVESGQHLLITGPNGAGKSSVARIIAGLWPTYRGLASRPKHQGQDGIMFLPQRPYLSPGTLRDQVIYPHTEMNMRDAGRRDRELQAILEQTRLGYLTDREGGWDTKKMWKDVLSGGEKQRVSIARLLYHEPRFAVIDEGTSAVSSDVEGLLYETCKNKGITLITISTRASLRRYHDYVLTLGLGPDARGYECLRIGTQSEKETVEKELKELRQRISQVEELKSRKQEIEAELNKVWIESHDDRAKAELDEPSYD